MSNVRKNFGIKARKSDFVCRFYCEGWQRTSGRACLALSVSSQQVGWDLVSQGPSTYYGLHFKESLFFFLAWILLFILYIDSVQTDTTTKKAALKSFKGIHQRTLSLYQTGIGLQDFYLNLLNMKHIETFLSLLWPLIFSWSFSRKKKKTKEWLTNSS